jgi:RNA polymerase sigma-70 factor (ECF subfamily)
MAESDQALVDSLKRGDLSAFRELYQRHRDSMLRLAIRVLGHRADAEDAVHDAFLTLYGKVAGFRGRSAFTTWFYRIVVNACLQIQRRTPRHSELGDQDAVTTLADKSEARETLEILDRAIQALPLKQRTVFSLAEIEGFSLKETAAILGIRSGTARYHLHMAKSRLRKGLRQWLGPHLDASDSKGSPAARSLKESAS